MEINKIVYTSRYLDLESSDFVQMCQVESSTKSVRLFIEDNTCNVYIHLSLESAKDFAREINAVCEEIEELAKKQKDEPS